MQVQLNYFCRTRLLDSDTDTVVNSEEGAKCIPDITIFAVIFANLR
jgi:hypothetical protein